MNRSKECYVLVDKKTNDVRNRIKLYNDLISVSRENFHYTREFKKGKKTNIVTYYTMRNIIIATGCFENDRYLVFKKPIKKVKPINKQ